MRDDIMFDEDLGRLLRLRRVPEPSADLAGRIVAAAAHRGQRRGFFAYCAGFAAEFASMLAVPRPAFALAVFLLIGLSTGIFADNVSVLPGMTPEDLATFMTIDDRFVAGEWL